MSAPQEDFTDKVLSWPGEYDFDGTFIRAIGQDDGKIISYACTIDGIHCAFVDAPVADWNDVDLEKLGNVDVLVINADDEKKVKDLVEHVDPRYILLIPGKGTLQGVVKACGVSSVVTETTVKIQASTMPTESREVIVLSA